METSAAAAVCVERGCAWSVFRGISDDAFDPTSTSAVLGLANPTARPTVSAIAKFVARHPNKIALLARLGKGLNQATQGAVDAALRSCS